jgi:hypothetical protein
MTATHITDAHGRVLCATHMRWIEQGGKRRNCPECPRPVRPVHIYGLLVDRVGMKYSDGSER